MPDIVAPRRSRADRIAQSLAVALLAACVTAIGSSPPPASAQTIPYFGAIAVDRSGGTYGYSLDYPTRVGAERRALRECRTRADSPGCRVVVWVRDGCASVAVRRRADGSLARVGWGIGTTRRQAQVRARTRCGAQCRMLAWTCTTR
jgi:hypothetical protein